MGLLLTFSDHLTTYHHRNPEATARILKKNQTPQTNTPPKKPQTKNNNKSQNIFSLQKETKSTQWK